MARGGRIAWGAIPTDGPRADSVDRHWRALAAVWCELVRAGCDPVALAHAGDRHARVRARPAHRRASRSSARPHARDRRPRARPSRRHALLPRRLTPLISWRLDPAEADSSREGEHPLDSLAAMAVPDEITARVDALRDADPLPQRALPRARRARDHRRRLRRAGARAPRARGRVPRAHHARLAHPAASARAPSATFAAVTHRVPMMSLDNAFSFDELVAWGTRAERGLAAPRARARCGSCAS